MRNRTFVIGGFVLALLAAGVWAQHKMGGSCQSKRGATTCPMLDVSPVNKAIDDAAAAVNAGEKDKALAALTSAKELLAKAQANCQEACKGQMGKACPMGKSPAPGTAMTFANARCPIMTGNAIDSAKVPPSLVREFKGQKIAFCCAGCPAQWDKLSDQEKQAKLDAVKVPATQPADDDCCK